MIKLTAYFREEVSEFHVARGTAMYNAQRVKIARIQGGFAGVVEDGDHYQVEMSTTANDSCMGCTCSAWESGVICGHFWAVILAIDSQGVELEISEEGGQHLQFTKEQQWDSPWQNRLETLRRDARHNWGPKPGRPLPFDGWIGYLVDSGASLSGGVLCVLPVLRKRLKNGSLGASSNVSSRTPEFSSLPLIDRQILSAMEATRSATMRGGSDSYELGAGILPLLIPFLANSGRVYAWGNEEWGRLPREVGEPMCVGSEPGRLIARHEHDKETGKATIRLVFQRGDEERELSASAALMAGGGLLDEQHLDMVDSSEDLLVRNLLDKGRIELPIKEDSEFLTGVLEVTGGQNLESEHLGIVEAADPRGRLDLEPPTRGRHARVPAQVSFDYGTECVPCLDTRQLIPLGEGKTLRRDSGAEDKLLVELVDKGCLMPDGYRRDEFELPPKSFETIVLALNESGWTVLMAGKPLHKISTPAVSVTTDRDWFDVEASVRVGDTPMHLPDLLRKIESGSKLVRLDDGSHGILPGKWLESWERLLNFGEEKDGHFRLRANQSWVLDALLAARPDTELVADAACSAARKELSALDGIRPKSPPKSFVGTLRPYQCEGLGWMNFLQKTGLGGCLADDMGLGKTVQVLALLESRRKKRSAEKTSLVVVPNSLIFNWREEAARFTPKMRVLDHTGPQRWSEHGDDPVATFADFDIVLTTYGTLRRDITKYENFHWDYAILDEAQAIKNASSQASKAARLLRADHRLAMSGTPIENHLGELWALFDFINPGMLGRSKVFQTFLKQREGLDTEAQHALVQQLGRGLSPFILRRKKDEVLDDLPEKVEHVLHCELPKQQRKSYDELRAHYQRLLLGDAKAEDLDRMKFVVLEALLRLRQTSCHPGLIDADRTQEDCAKFDVLIPKLEELVGENHKALVFSQFPSFLKLLRERLDALGIRYEYLDGKTKNRQEPVERFQTDADCPLFLISLKAGGHGLNLTAADYVFILDPWWNPAVEAQAVDRAHRIGQKNKVMAYRLICKDTVEEHVASLQAEKKQLADAILSADSSILKGLTVADLTVLLG